MILTKASWTSKIKDRLQDSESTGTERKQAIEIIEYWRSRSSILSTLSQDLNKPVVQAIRKVEKCNCSACRPSTCGTTTTWTTTRRSLSTG